MARSADPLPFLSVVIPTWNRAGRLEGCLATILQQDYPSDRWELIVADDGSTDDTRLVAEAAAVATPVRVRHVLGKHGGINSARNVGIGVAEGEILVFVDDDELVPPTHLSKIAKHLCSRPDLAGVGGPMLDAGNPKVPMCAECGHGSARLPYDEPAEVPGLLGGNMAVRRQAIDEAGLFDANLSGRADEHEWFERAARRFLYDPDLPIRHRRDDMGLWELCRTQFVQGRSLPRMHAKQGDRYRPRLRRSPRLLAHSIRRRCGRGYVLVARDLGAWYELLAGRAFNKRS